MRCKTCHYSLLNLTEHRCPECGAAFDPNDPSTFDAKRLRNWPAFACIAAIGVGTWCYITFTDFKAHLVPPHEIPLFYQAASAAFDGFLSAMWIMLLLLLGFVLGRWQVRR